MTFLAAQSIPQLDSPASRILPTSVSLSSRYRMVLMEGLVRRKDVLWPERVEAVLGAPR